MVRQLLFLFHGRFVDEEVRKIFDHVNWDMSRGFAFVLESEAEVIRGVTGQTDESTIKEVKTDPTILDALQNGIKKETRQFACKDCDRAWWRKVPLRKEVSECRRCKQKYDPVPREYEWGWATYHCVCGNEFSGSGQKNTSAPCYECEESVFPSEIKPFRKRRHRKTNNNHCCDAPDCTGKHNPVPIHDVDPQRVYDDGSSNDTLSGRQYNSNGTVDSVARQVDQLQLRTNDNKQQNVRSRRQSTGIHTCVSPQSRTGKKKVVYPSERHISTGSTVATFLTQSDVESSYAPSLPSIPEHNRRFGRRH